MKVMKLLCFAALSLCTASQVALAGDAAELNVLGFSADGKVFAFEEYGIQDGSGFAYANRFYIDTTSDAFLPGTPVRVQMEDESIGLDAARAEARKRGDKVVKEDELAANRGRLAGFNAVTETSADPFSMTVNPRPVFPPIDPQLAFKLEEISFGEIERCAGLGPVKGFKLVRVGDGGKTDVLQEDKDVPQSRGCPTGYRIGGVQTFFGDGGTAAYAVLVTVIRHGFEGPDHRWIAVTGRL
ncbi:putative secreted protein [Aminobacter aminovorans]|uniref:Predicted secreted protein n=1 Tax=Aminobacter aminovorans TaxID=83263 RepID=A0A380WPQ8_AMIAI|nr:DUF2259 domain-containing protein [Aminobacter aminovorans]TCS26013.1 putative secreted protein [Aminobacter aminovorans]SUU90322.1 Predicted secreted protein [Aminobacter aminovorans]